MAHRRDFERRSSGDPVIIGRRVYRVDTEDFIGIAQLHWFDAGRSVLSILPEGPTQNPVFIQVEEVLIETSRKPPHLELDERLDQRDKSFHPLDSPDRQKRRERAKQEGAEDFIREPGISDDVAEPGLPLHRDGIDYSKIHRPETDEIHPVGGGLGRGRDTGKEDDENRTSTTPGGSSMASVGEVKAAIDAANFTAAEAQQAASVAIEKLDETMQQLLIALDGSGHDSVAVAKSLIEHAKQQLQEGIQAISGSIESSSGYAGAL